MIFSKHIYTVLLIVTTVLFSGLASSADWTLDQKQSQLNFMSVKKGSIAENHQFTSLQGQLNTQGELEINIDLASVDTAIDLRNERMKEFLFNTQKYSQATLTAQVDLSAVDDMPVASSAVMTVAGTLNLHGQDKALDMIVLVTKLSANNIVVTSAEPVLLNVADFDLVVGVEKLRELAKLPSISPAVPVTFYITLNK